MRLHSVPLKTVRAGSRALSVVAPASSTIIPASLKFGSNQPVLGINCIVLPTRTRSFIPGLFKRQLFVPYTFVLFRPRTLNGLK